MRKTLSKISYKKERLCDFSKGLEEINKDISNRMWNILVLSPMPKEELTSNNNVQDLVIEIKKQMLSFSICFYY